MFGKRNSKIILLIFSCLITGACRREIPQAPNEIRGSISIELAAKIPETKSIISEGIGVSSFLFEENDSIAFFAGDLLQNCGLKCINPSGKFRGLLELDSPEQTESRPSIWYYSYSPYTSNAGSDPSSLRGKLPTVQSAPFDGHADYLVATPLENRYDIDNFPNLFFDFSTHLFAIVKLSVTTTVDMSDEQIDYIGLRSTVTPLTGFFNFDVTDPSQLAILSSNPEDVSQWAKVRYAEDKRPSLEKDAIHTVYAVVNAATYAAGSLRLVIQTTKNRYYLPTTASVTLSREAVTVFPTVDLTRPEIVKSGDIISSFSLSDGVLDYSPAYEITDTLISVHVPNAMDVSKMKARFEHNGLSVKVDGIEQTSEVSENDFGDFTAPKKYVVSSPDGETRSYTIRIFNLPVLFITTPSPITSNTVWTDGCTITLMDDAGNFNLYEASAEVRGRGNSTWYRPKKALTFKLSSKASVLGMPADKRWNLLANWYDHTMIRNDVSLEIAHRAEGLDWASHGKFVELIMNGEFIGTYYLCEHNKISKDRVNITEMSVGDTSPETISGGYLLEYDEWEDSDPFFKTGTCNYKVKFKDPDDDGFDLQWNWIENYINNLESVLANPDSLAAHKYLKYMDIDSYIDWWLVYEISGVAEPNVPRSSFMYKDRGGKMYAGPVWDFDQQSYNIYMKGFRIKNSLYYKYLFGDPYFVFHVKERWKLLKTNIEGMPDYIDAITNAISRAAIRNAEIWPISEEGDHNYDGRIPVMDALVRLKSVYQSRIIELDGLISALEATPSDKGTGNEDYDGQDDQTSDFGFGF